MHTTWKRITSCLIVICLTAAILAGLTSITERKNSLEKYMQFFEQEADFDVLFMGSSKVINSILPMELWKDYGIISYNMGGHGNTIPISYWVLRNALDYTTPKCVVLDCYGSDWNGRINDNFHYAHLSFDAFPLSTTKIQAVLDLINPDKVEDGHAKRMELLWNFSTYHSRWNELDRNDFFPHFTYQKGAEPRANVSIPAAMAEVSPEQKNTEETNGIRYLKKTIELCQERGIDVILTHMPYPASESDQIAANTVADIARQYGVEYLNFLTMDVVDYQTDLHDPDSHLNPSGAFKITDHMGKLLSERYKIPDQRENPAYQSWYEDAEMYRQEKHSQFEDATCAWNYWMLLSDDDFSFLAELSENDLQKDDVLAKLLRNAGISPENVQGRCIIAANRNTGTVTFTQYETLLQGPAETALGTLTLAGNCLQLEESECWQIDAQETVMRFALLDEAGKMLGNTQFSSEEIRSPKAD